MDLLRTGFALAVLWTAVATAQQPLAKPSGAASVLPLTSDQVLTHVRRSVSWYRDLSSVEQISLPGVDSVARAQLQQQALTTVRLAFEFGKAAADILGREAQARSAIGAGQGGPGGRTAGRTRGQTTAKAHATPTLTAQLAQAAADFSAREATLKSQLAAIDARLRRVRGGSVRASLTAQRAGTVAALQLVQQIESNIDQLRHFQESAVAGQGKPPKGLRAQLAALERSVSQLSTGEGPAGEAAGAPRATLHPRRRRRSRPGAASNRSPPASSG